MRDTFSSVNKYDNTHNRPGSTQTPAKKKGSHRWSDIPGYLLSIGLCVVFALYCSGRVGWFLVLTLVCAPVLSFLFLLLFRKSIVVQCHLLQPLAAKGEHCTLQVILHNRCVLPSPAIEVELYDSPYIFCSRPKTSVSLMPRSTQDFSCTFTATVCGASKIGIQKILIRDYLGLFSFALPVPALTEIDVIPDIAEVSSEEEYIRQIYRLSREAGDSEETLDSATTLSGGFPGYDHREYIPGDPLKRMNWKLSARRDKLYVRLDEETASSKVCIFLNDTLRVSKEDLENLPPTLYNVEKPGMEIPLLVQNAVETSLGAARVLLSHKLSIRYIYRDAQTHSLCSTDLHKEEELPEFARSLASFSIDCDGTTDSNNLLGQSDIPLLIFTAGHAEDISIHGSVVYSALNGKGRLL